MAQTVNVNFRMDAELKKSMEQTCEDMGMTMTAAFTIFAKKVSREKRMPFEISAGSFTPNEDTYAAIEEVRQMKKDPSVGKSYTDVDQMMKELLV